MIRLPLHTGQRVRQLDREERRLAAALGREPEPAELALALEWSVEEVARVGEFRRGVLSLDEPVAEDGATELGELLADAEAAAPDALAEAALLAEAVQAVLATLRARERAVIEARYGLGPEPAGTVSETAAGSACRRATCATSRRWASAAARHAAARAGRRRLIPPRAG